MNCATMMTAKLSVRAIARFATTNAAGAPASTVRLPHLASSASGGSLQTSCRQPRRSTTPFVHASVKLTFGYALHCPVEVGEDQPRQFKARLVDHMVALQHMPE
jgi:hypothetical protein